MLINQEINKKQKAEKAIEVIGYIEEGELFDILEEGELCEIERQQKYSKNITPEGANKLDMNTKKGFSSD